MAHEINLITTIAAALGLALVMGFVASRCRIPPVVGYLVAGIIIGPATPGFVADIGLTRQLAEIGVMLLMFGVGLHFSLGDLMAVRRIAVPAALVQIAVATALGGRDRALLGLDVAVPLWCSVSPCRWRARSCCCGRSRIAAYWTRSTAASPSAGWSSKTW